MSAPAYTPNLPRQLLEYPRTFKRDPQQFFLPRQDRICTCCGFRGKFISMRKNRREARCPNCSSRERDRLFCYYLNRNGHQFAHKRVLHFSPESFLFNRLKSNPDYISGDIKKSKYARYFVDITKIPYPDNHFDYIICHHVIEHVDDDMLALRECLRVLRPGGTAFISVPLMLDQEKTFEPPADMPTEEVDRICGWDHKRLYGRDFIDRVKAAGFSTQMFLLEGEELERYRTGFDPIYIATK